MSEHTYTKALVIGSWGADSGSLEGLAHEVSEGDYRVVNEADVLTLAQALQEQDRVLRESAHRLVITHGAGMLAVRRAGIIVALNGVEPTPLHLTLANAGHALRPEAIPDESVPIPSFRNALHDIAQHPKETLKVSRAARKFSTLQTMIDRRADFPDGRIYLPTQQDEFGFGQHDHEIERAQRDGIIAHMLPGYHNQQLLHPREGAQHIAAALNELHPEWL